MGNVKRQFTCLRVRKIPRIKWTKMDKEEKQHVVKSEKEAFGRAKMKLRKWQINQYTSARGKERKMVQEFKVHANAFFK